MPTAITGSEGGKLNYLPEKMEARMILANLKTQITGQNGVVKPGVLKLMHTTPGSPGNMTFERKRWWQFWARRDSKMATTADYLKTLFRRAYGGRDNYNSDEKFDSLMAEFDRYLEQRNNRAGTRTVNDFIARFESEFPENYEKFYLPPARDLTTGWQADFQKALQSTLSEFAKKGAVSIPNFGPPSKSISGRAQKLASKISNAIALSDGRDPGVEPLGSGSFGAVYSFIGEDGKHQAIKFMFPKVECEFGPNASVRGGEVCASRLKNKKMQLRIIHPDFYLMKRSQDGLIFKIPAENLKGFLRDQKYTCDNIALIMPMCSGTALDDKERTISHSEMKVIGKQSLETLTGLANRGFIHGDIKPDNILFDSEKGEMNFIDTGLMKKMKRAGNGRHLETDLCGTPLYLHPRIIRNQPYGSEVDLFALALTMLNVRFPSAKDALSDARLSFEQHFIRDRIQKTLMIPKACKQSWETPVGNYLENLINITLNIPKLPEGARKDLDRMKEALSSAKGDDGELLSFINSAINTSFAGQEDYQERLEELSHHPFLQESTS